MFSAAALPPSPPQIHPPNRAVNCHQFIPTKQLLMCFISSTSSTAQTSCPSAFFFMLLSIKWTPKQKIPSILSAGLTPTDRYDPHVEMQRWDDIDQVRDRYAGEDSGPEGRNTVQLPT